MNRRQARLEEWIVTQFPEDEDIVNSSWVIEENEPRAYVIEQMHNQNTGENQICFGQYIVDQDGNVIRDQLNTNIPSSKFDELIRKAIVGNFSGTQGLRVVLTQEEEISRGGMFFEAIHDQLEFGALCDHLNELTGSNFDVESMSDFGWNLWLINEAGQRKLIRSAPTTGRMRVTLSEMIDDHQTE